MIVIEAAKQSRKAKAANLLCIISYYYPQKLSNGIRWNLYNKKLNMTLFPTERHSFRLVILLNKNQKALP